MAVVAAFIMPHPPILVPAVGRGGEKKIIRTAGACERVAKKIAELAPETIVVTSPHSVLYADYFHISPGKHARGDFGAFGAPSQTMECSYDMEFAEALSEEAEKKGLPAGPLGERDPLLDHGVMVPLSFINRACHGFRLVRCSLSGLGPMQHYAFGQCIAETAERLQRRVVLIASGDLSHKLKEDGPYGFAPEGPEFDRQITEAMKAGDFLRFLSFDPDLCESAAECGLRSFVILAGAFDRLSVTPEFFSYEGPYGVGYAVCGFTPGETDDSRHFAEQYARQREQELRERKDSEDAYVRLARLSLETWVREGRRASLPEGLPPELTRSRAGVFVSLKKDGQLRGCIGTILPVHGSIADEILRNAVSAGTRDPRFDAVTENELPDLIYSVDVLGKTEPIRSMNELDTKRYGVIVRRGDRSGLLLPNLAGIDTSQKQVEIALEKGGISPDESYTMERFEVVRHK